MVISDLNISTNIFRGMQKKKLLKSLDQSTPTTDKPGLDEAAMEKKMKDAVDEKVATLTEKTPVGKFRYEQSKINNLKKLLANPEETKKQIDSGADLNLLLLGTSVVVDQTKKELDNAKNDLKASNETIDDNQQYMFPVPGYKINSRV
jgi:hypothetical protein